MHPPAAMAEPPKMGAKSLSMPSMTGESASSSSMDNGHPGVQQLLQRMPSQYAFATSLTDRVQHARLLAAKAQDPVGVTNVHLSWAAEGGGTHATIWLVFADRRGSLGLITALLSELGVNIGKASVFSTSDGVAVDSFSVDRCVRRSGPWAGMREFGPRRGCGLETRRLSLIHISEPTRPY